MWTSSRPSSLLISRPPNGVCLVLHVVTKKESDQQLSVVRLAIFGDLAPTVVRVPEILPLTICSSYPGANLCKQVQSFYVANRCKPTLVVQTGANSCNHAKVQTGANRCKTGANRCKQCKQLQTLTRAP
jgi:hypothetical protein